MTLAHPALIQRRLNHSSEWMEMKGPVRMKAATVTERTELDDLKARLDKLQVIVKFATQKKEKERKKTPRTSP